MRHSCHDTFIYILKFVWYVKKNGTYVKKNQFVIMFRKITLEIDFFRKHLITNCLNSKIKKNVSNLTCKHSFRSTFIFMTCNSHIIWITYTGKIKLIFSFVKLFEIFFHFYWLSNMLFFWVWFEIFKGEYRYSFYNQSFEQRKS